MPRGSLLDWIAFNLLPGLGPLGRRNALARFGDPGVIAHRAPEQSLATLPRVGSKAVGQIRAARRTLRKRAERERQRCEKLGIALLSCDDPDYPAALHELPDAPILLYVRGRLPAPVLRVGVVGSRTPTAYGRRVATGLTCGLAARGIETVSGGARGVDTCAHRAALEEGGRTVAVLGSGLLRLYPVENGRLFDEIAEKGAVVSEFELERDPNPKLFPRRNRLISGLSAAVVVVEAALRSGSLSTANHALEQGREVLAVPGPVSSPRSVGCHRLIQQGAKLVQNIEDILEELPPMYRTGLATGGALVHSEAQPNLDGLTADERTVLGLLDEIEPVHVDELADKTPFGVARLQAALFGLEVRGAVEHSPGRYYLLRPCKEP